MKPRLPILQVEPPIEQPLVEARITGGMNSRIDPADISNSQATLFVNGRTSADFTRRAPGVTALAGTAPDAKPVLMYTQWYRFDGTTVFLRFTEDRIDKYSNGTYTQLTGTLNGTAQDGIRFVQTADASDDYFIFTNNGADKIQVLNSTPTSFAALSSSTTINTKYKYICAFFNRIVAANRVASASSPTSSANPVLIAWSGDFNFTEWNPANDISAGSTPLVEAQSDYADPITGLFGFASVMLILRERSLWIATKRPVASNPFAFQAAFPYVGCDTPSSATQTRNGIVWYDYRTNQVYVYEVGSPPRPIGDAIKNNIIGAITDRDLVWGSYDQINNTYFLTIPSTTTTNARIFHYNFDTGSWGYDDKESAYGVYPVDGGASRLDYDQLTGTYAELTAAVSTYDDIGVTAASPPVNYIGYTDGVLRYEDVNADNFLLAQESGTGLLLLESGSGGILLENSNAGQLNWTSKIYRIPSGDQMISRLMILFRPTRTGNFNVEYRKNSSDWVQYKNISFAATQGRTRIYFTKLIRANEFQWRVLCERGNLDLLEYKIDLSVSPEDKTE
jgi:hypothetical protein